jgi:hypothetical protein
MLMFCTASAESLRSDAESFLARLRSHDYTCVAVKMLQLQLMEPCTLSLFPPAGACTGGYYAALGGNNILDLDLRLEGSGWWLQDSLPDDIPVLQVDSAQIQDGRRLIVCAMDMLRGARVDSVAVLWAYAPVDRNL